MTRIPKTLRTRICWTDAADKLLASLWTEGVGIKAIAYEVGHPIGSVKRRRLTLGLTPRRPVGGQRGHPLTVWYSDEEYEALNRGAHRRRTTKGQYVRALVRRDAGGSGGVGSVVVHHDRGEQRTIISNECGQA